MQKHFSAVEILSCYLMLWATLESVPAEAPHTQYKEPWLYLVLLTCLQSPSSPLSAAARGVRAQRLPTSPQQPPCPLLPPARRVSSLAGSALGGCWLPRQPSWAHSRRCLWAPGGLACSHGFGPTAMEEARLKGCEVNWLGGASGFAHPKQLMEGHCKTHLT